MYDRTISFYTFSKTYAMTGLRLGYVAAKDAGLRDRMKKALFYTASNVASVVQFGGIGALEGSQARVAEFRDELKARRDLFYAGLREHAAGVFTGEPPKGAFYAFLRINPDWAPLREARRVAVVGDDGVPDRRRDASAACRASTSAPTARGTSDSASRETEKSSPAPSPR